MTYKTFKIYFFADKFAREVLKYKCSESIFTVAEETTNFISNTNSVQEQFNFENE